EREVGIAAIGTAAPGGDYLSIRLNRQGPGAVFPAGDVGHYATVTVECLIKCAIRIVSSEGHCMIVHSAGHHDLAIRLNLDVIGNIAATEKINGCFTVAVKRSVEAAIQVIAGEGEVIGSRDVGQAAGHYAVLAEQSQILNPGRVEET